jgi:hypothetical protein
MYFSWGIDNTESTEIRAHELPNLNNPFVLVMVFDVVDSPLAVVDITLVHTPKLLKLVCDI